ncbi:MAG: response regulator [Phycisphaerae bacterium]
MRFSACVSRGIVALAAALPLALTANAQDTFSGVSEQYQDSWRTALQAILDRNQDAAEESFQALLEDDVTPFRLALLAEDSVRRGRLGGGLLLFEQDASNDALGANGKKIAEMLAEGREQMNQADDGFYFASLGRFDVANANFKALLESNPDPVAFLEFVEQKPRRRAILANVVSNPVIADSARGIVDLIESGEAGLHADPRRIRTNIERLAGPPRGYENALFNLRESGDAAVPFIIEYLNKADRTDLLQPLLRVLPDLDRTAVTPLAISLKMPDTPTKKVIVETLGGLGYRQALPYLLKLRDAEGTAQNIRQAAEQSIAQLRGKAGASAGSNSAAAEFYALAQEYYANSDSVAPDSRGDLANVWYWNDGYLQNIEVPTPIYDEVMAMRCCEEALLLDPDHKPSISLWLAANFRRAAQLPADTVDDTRPENDPTPIYYAQSAGAEHCLSALQLALQNNEPEVALGCIEALRNTAGPAILVAEGPGATPLAEALTASNQLVRIQAALTLARATPRKSFPNQQNLIPVLAEAITLSGGQKNALVVDAEDESANEAAAALRDAGYTVISDANLNAGLEKARKDFPTLDLMILAADLQNPPLRDGIQLIRRDYRFAGVPVLVMSKPGTRALIREVSRLGGNVGIVPEGAAAEDVSRQIENIMERGKNTTIDAEKASALALEAVRAIRDLGTSDANVVQLNSAELALLAALKSENAELQTAGAEALALVPTESAQEGIIAVAFDAEKSEELRVAMFDALALAGRRVGNKLTGASVEKLVAAAASESNLTLREAASRALGALNVSGNPASEIIRNQHRG